MYHDQKANKLGENNASATELFFHFFIKILDPSKTVRAQGKLPPLEPELRSDLHIFFNAISGVPNRALGLIENMDIGTFKVGLFEYLGFCCTANILAPDSRVFQFAQIAFLYGRGLTGIVRCHYPGRHAQELLLTSVIDHFVRDLNAHKISLMFPQAIAFCQAELAGVEDKHKTKELEVFIEALSKYLSKYQEAKASLHTYQLLYRLARPKLPVIPPEINRTIGHYLVRI